MKRLCKVGFQGSNVANISISWSCKVNIPRDIRSLFVSVSDSQLIRNL